MITLVSAAVFFASNYFFRMLTKNPAKTHIITFNTVDYHVTSTFAYRSQNRIIPLHANLDPDIQAVASTVASDIGAGYKGPMPKLDQLIFDALSKTFQDQPIWFSFNITSTRSSRKDYDDVDIIGR